MRGYIFKFWEEIFKIDHQIRYKCLYFEQEEKKKEKKKEKIAIARRQGYFYPNR
jgi:hypothetical protein